MISISRITKLDELLHVWPRLMVLSTADQPAETLKTALACLVNGAIFLVRADGGLMGSCYVAKLGDIGVIYSLPKEGGEGMHKRCLAAVTDWAKAEGLQWLQITNNRWNGSSFRYFEKSLGFERKLVTFVKKL